jgi:hypothetical protein
LVENVEKDIEGYENLALKYAETSPEEREVVLEKMITRNLQKVGETNNPAELLVNEEALVATIKASELSGKGSATMKTGRDQMLEAIQKRKQELQSIEDNGNTVFENQLLNRPVESFGETMQVAQATKLAMLLHENRGNVRGSVFMQVNDKLEASVKSAQERLSELSPKERSKVLARELARLETITPGTTFNKEAIESVFNTKITDKEHEEVIKETAEVIKREGEKLESDSTVVADEKDPIMDALIANFQKEPRTIDTEDAEGNPVKVSNEKRTQKIKGAVDSLFLSRSRKQLKSRFKSLFSALGFTTEDVNKGLEDLNAILDNVEPTNPGEIYTRYLNYINPEKFRAVSEVAENIPAEVVNGEEVITTEPEVVVGDLTLDPVVDEVLTDVEVPAEVVNPKLEGLVVKPINNTNSQETNVSATVPTVFTQSNGAVQSQILKTVGENPESYRVKVLDLFSFIREAIGKKAITKLSNLYTQVGQALETDNQEEIDKLKLEFMEIFPEGTFSLQMLEYIWEKQFVLGKSDQDVTIKNEDASPIQIAKTYKKKEGVVTFFKGTEKISYVVEVTGNVVNGKIEVISKKGLKTSLISASSFVPYTLLPINARAEFFQINSVMATVVNKSNGKIGTFDAEGKKTSKGKVNAFVTLSREDPAINEVRENIKTNTPVSFTGPIVGNAAVNKASSYENSKTGVYLEFDNSNYPSTISTQTVAQFVPEVLTPETVTTPEPTVDQNAVVVTIPKELMDILTENITSKATGSQNNPSTPDEQNQQEDAASCGIN